MEFQIKNVPFKVLIKQKKILVVLIFHLQQIPPVVEEIIVNSVNTIDSTQLK